MLIYQNSTESFIKDIRNNRLSDIMQENFVEGFGRRPNPSEYASWQNSLPRVRDLIELAELKQNMIALEYEVPYNENRIDCLLYGRGLNSEENVVLIELKQWTNVTATDVEGNFVETFTGGGEKVVPHPSQQTKGYHNFIRNFITEFENPPSLVLFSCAYCHNYTKVDSEGLFNPIYTKIIDDFPLYTKDDVQIIAEKLKSLLTNGDGVEIFNRFMRSPIRPSQKLLENVTKVIKNEAVFSLINEQLVAKNLIWAKVRKSIRGKENSVIIVHGGPGTGKSVIAINVLAEAAHRGKKVFYGCKSKPFSEGLKKLVGKDGKMLFSNLYRFLPSKVAEKDIDILLIDEAHRIELSSNHRYTKAVDRTDMPQVEQLIRCSKTSVFFIDDMQNVRSQEIGSSELIIESARKLNRTISEVELVTQFRCMGSNDYLLWLESVLGYSEEKRILRRNDVFDFQIYDSPQKIYDIILEKEEEKSNSARMVAGFCWPWSKELDNNGEFVKDVKIGDFEMPWETPDSIGKPPPGYVKWFEWAYKPEGVKQIGCIYTAQGFEFDYIGVVIGEDLQYDSTTDNLIGNIDATEDTTLRRKAESFDTYVKNIYRTLLTRGMKGCYVFFTNKETENYFRERMEI